MLQIFRLLLAFQICLILTDSFKITRKLASWQVLQWLFTNQFTDDSRFLQIYSSKLKTLENKNYEFVSCFCVHRQSSSSLECAQGPNSLNEGSCSSSALNICWLISPLFNPVKCNTSWQLTAGERQLQAIYSDTYIFNCKLTNVRSCGSLTWKSDFRQSFAERKLKRKWVLMLVFFTRN